MDKYTGMEIAVIGMSGRFPGAEDIKGFWHNLINAVESVSMLSDEEILQEGEDKSILEDPRYVKANAFIAGKENFDAGFFGYRPEEAKLMNPQIRIFHEACWNAIEDAGYDVKNNNEKIGLFAGASSDVNWENYTFLINEDNLVDDYTASQLRDVTYLCSRVSYQFNLQGPCMFINTACSTSLVAVQRACMSLLLRECNMALAGGISVNNYSKKGYLYQEGMINSPDGHCRTFDANAKGTVGGEGVGVVVLKRLSEAVRDRDHIYAVIKGGAINNDGNQKISFTAPSVEGQHKAILKALNMAQTEPQSISYIEAHGTATELGDPVEVEALNSAFGKSREKYCALGSVKSNIGHLDTAAGVAGLIKTVLALKYRKIPASLHFKAPSPRIDFRNSPFYVNTECKEWRNDKYPLRAGVSSFGIGGTNAHLIVEESPAPEPASESRSCQLIVLSARTGTALERNIENVRKFLEQETEANFADIAYTLQTGRTPFEYRYMAVCADKEEALALLSARTQVNAMPVDYKSKQPVVFMFPGQGSQYAGMCHELYNNEEVFKAVVDKCFTIVQDKHGKDLKDILFSKEVFSDEHAINNTEFAQPALFIVEYALSQLLITWGIHPDMMIGHSVGEYVAACVSGAFSLEDALTLVVKRGELMQRAAKGTMLGISIAIEELSILLSDHKEISLAAINSPKLCVVSGRTEDIATFRKLLGDGGYSNKILRTSHAFHSHMMDQITDEFLKEVNKVSIRAGKIPFISNLTGDWATVTQPQYWVDHLRQTVLFSQGIGILLKKKNCSFIEVGPGNTLSTFVRSNTCRTKEHKVFQLVKHAQDAAGDLRYFMKGIGELWLNGINADWRAFYKTEKRKRISLPPYSFDRTKYPVIVNSFKMISERIAKGEAGKIPEISKWFYIPTW